MAIHFDLDYPPQNAVPMFIYQAPMCVARRQEMSFTKALRLIVDPPNGWDTTRVMLLVAGGTLDYNDCVRLHEHYGLA